MFVSVPKGDAIFMKVSFESFQHPNQRIGCCIDS